MILATVGTQLPFPRLLKALTSIAQEHGIEIVAQTAQPPGTYPALIEHRFLEPDRFEQLVADCSLLVSHAGIGSILTATRLGRPCLLYPRRFALGEHRNDHQLATAERLCAAGIVDIAWDDGQLKDAILRGTGRPPQTASTAQRNRLIGNIAAFLATPNQARSSQTSAPGPRINCRTDAHDRADGPIQQPVDPQRSTI